MASSLITEYKFKDDFGLEFELVELSLLYKNHANKLITPHRTSFYHILWFQQDAIHYVDFEPVHIKANCLLFLNKGVVQQYYADETKGKALLFTDSFMARHPDALTFLKSTVLFNDLLETAQIQIPSGDPSIPSLYDAISTESGHARDGFQQAILLNYLHNLLQLSERHYRQQGFREIKKSADLDYTLLFRNELETHYKTVRQVSKYASRLNVTEKRLNAATTKVLGRTPKGLIDERVMLESKRLLAHTWLSVKEIGYELGFDEPTNFIKYFRKHSGKTPVEFREEITG